MPRKIYYKQSKHRYVRSNSYYGNLWLITERKDGTETIPVAPNWRYPEYDKSPIHKGKK